ncbi:hypothetical protein SASPL_110041 [Salvia splendens]|uniref:Uncharacterized protein n=1 Tax=Salvia splendens TaxID=180675 RepID=A0A8X8Y9X9_SALSN|nr:hypothetical protein SASPL_110041 [Salvia splendens]
MKRQLIGFKTHCAWVVLVLVGLTSSWFWAWAAGFAPFELVRIHPRREECDTTMIEFPLYAHDISKELITPFVMRENGLNKIPDVKDMPSTVNMPQTTASKKPVSLNPHMRWRGRIVEMNPPQCGRATSQQLLTKLVKISVWKWVFNICSLEKVIENMNLIKIEIDEKMVLQDQLHIVKSVYTAAADDDAASLRSVSAAHRSRAFQRAYILSTYCKQLTAMGISNSTHSISEIHRT